MKKALLVIIIIFMVTACSNDVIEIGIDDKVEDNKLTYLNIKNNLDSQRVFNNIEDIPCDINVSIDKIKDDREIIESIYKVIKSLSNE